MPSWVWAFLSTLSLRRATYPYRFTADRVGYFYPRSPCGERPRASSALSLCSVNFYPRSPCGERRQRATSTSQTGHFYPRSPCGERQADALGLSQIVHFYPRSPCGERPGDDRVWYAKDAFLSTLSLRSATLAGYPTLFDDLFLSTLSLRRATCRSVGAASMSTISIHALLAESDMRSTQTTLK